MQTETNRPVYGRVKRKVVLGQIPAGNPIKEKILQDELSSGQVPIQEALIKLAAEGLVEFVPGRGFFSKAHDLAEIIGNYDLLRFFLTDAAVYIASANSRRRHLATIVRQSPLNSDMSNDLFDGIQAFDDIVSRLYRRPHSELLVRALYRCAYLLHVDAILNSDDLTEGTRIYLAMIRRGQIDAVEHQIRSFWEQRKSRLPETLAFAANMDSHPASMRT